MIEHQTRSDLLALIPPNAIIAEIGVFKGEFSREILMECQPKTLVLVDIWVGTFGSGDKDGKNHVEVPDMLKTYLQLAMSHVDTPSVRLVRCDSKSFFEHWTPNFFDAVYIDADHSYESVFMDMVGSMKVVKPGGFIMGHDYHGQVRQAVDDFCQYHGLEISAVTKDGCPSFLVRLPVDDLRPAIIDA